MLVAEGGRRDRQRDRQTSWPWPLYC